MDLYKKQLELQKDSVKELKERIETTLQIQEKLFNRNRNKLKKTAKGYKDSLEQNKLKVLIKQLNTKIISYKQEHFKEPFKKLIKKYQSDFNSIFNFQNKNIENFIATPLSISLVNYVDKSNNFREELEKLKRENVNFKDLKIKDLKDIIEFTYNIYRDDFKDLFTKLKEADQFCSSLILFIPSADLSYILIDFILQIQQYENEKSEEFNALNRQNRGDELFNKIRRYLTNKEFDVSFIDDKKEQLIAQTLIDLLIELKYLKEEKKEITSKDYIYLNTTSEFEEKIRSIKEKLINVRVRYKPMVVPPRPWRDIDNGGFLKDKSSSDEFNLILIKHNIYNRFERKEVLKQKGNIPQEMLDTINTIQNVPYKVNIKTLTTLKKLNNKLQFNRFGKIDKIYYDKVRYYKEYIELNNISSFTALEEKLINYYEEIKLNIKNKKKKENFFVNEIVEYELKFAKIALENKNNSKYWIDFDIFQKLAKLQNSLSLLLEIADEFKRYEKIYFVWQIDFRGRVYPIQTLLNPQGGDVAKSLLLFDKEQKLDERGIFWFKVHGANLYGEVDKEVFEKRIEWIDNNKENILDSAKDPLNCDFWKKADEPFEFLAFCFEYEKFIENPDNFSTSLPVAIDGSNNGLQHISTLLRDIESAKKVNVLPTGKVEDIYKFIATTLYQELEQELEKFEKERENLIQKGNVYFREEEQLLLDKRFYAEELIEQLQRLDISTIGNKKFSTTLHLKKEKKEYLDEIEDKIVKKYHHISKENLYKRILRELRNNYEDYKFDIEDGILDNNGNKIEKKLVIDERSLIKLLLQDKKIDRKFVKKPVMTDSYGSTMRGKANKILEEIEFLKNKIDIKDNSLKNTILMKFSTYLAQLIEEAIAKNSQASVNYEEFIKKIADYILKTDNHIYWLTPLGFKVQQLEYESKKTDINLADGGKLRIRIFQNKIARSAKKAHKQGILPNFIHSLDAAHLYKTVNSCQKQGLEYFMTVHDSFATLPNDMDILAQTLREEFINLYKKPILENLVEYIKEEFKLKFKKEALIIPYVNKNEFNLQEVKNSLYFFA